ncbi:hypothetical protein GEMRC1_002427 [Eukaryota sp. GEM-RC1]
MQESIPIFEQRIISEHTALSTIYSNLLYVFDKRTVGDVMEIFRSQRELVLCSSQTFNRSLLAKSNDLTVLKSSIATAQSQVQELFSQCEMISKNISDLTLLKSIYTEYALRLQEIQKRPTSEQSNSEIQRLSAIRDSLTSDIAILVGDIARLSKPIAMMMHLADDALRF